MRVRKILPIGRQRDKLIFISRSSGCLAEELQVCTSSITTLPRIKHHTSYTLTCYVQLLICTELSMLKQVHFAVVILRVKFRR